MIYWCACKAQLKRGTTLPYISMLAASNVLRSKRVYSLRLWMEYALINFLVTFLEEVLHLVQEPHDHSFHNLPSPSPSLRQPQEVQELIIGNYISIINSFNIYLMAWGNVLCKKLSLKK